MAVRGRTTRRQQNRANYPRDNRPDRRVFFPHYHVVHNVLLEKYEVVSVTETADTHGIYDEKYEKEGTEYNTFGGYIGLGYKAIFGKDRGGLAIESFMEYNYPFYTNIPFTGSLEDRFFGAILGIKGIRLGISFGAAF
jgi:hypothetical protein